jgi:hypothetical protein
MLVRITLLLGAAILGAGCASGPAPAASRHPAPRNRVFASSFLEPSSDRSASFVMTRDTGYTGSAAGIDVFLDGQRIARLAASETVTVYVTPGQHLLGARFSWGPVPPTERAFDLSSQQQLKVRVTTEAHSTNLDLKPESGVL